MPASSHASRNQSTRKTKNPRGMTRPAARPTRIRITRSKGAESMVRVLVQAADEKPHLPPAPIRTDVFMPVGCAPGRHVDQDDGVVREHFQHFPRPDLPDPPGGLDDRHWAIEPQRVQG